MTVDGVTQGMEDTITNALSTASSGAVEIKEMLSHTGQSGDSGPGKLPSETSEAKLPVDVVKACLIRQRMAVKKCLMSSLVLDQEWHVISIQWFQQWQKYVGYKKYEEKYLGMDEHHPGPIDNSDIIELVMDDLKPGLVNESDYVLLRGDAWTMLVEYYELVPGQVLINRRVISRGSDTRLVLEVEVYQVAVQVALFNGDLNTTVSYQFSKSATLCEVAERARELLSLNSEQHPQLRLWLLGDENRVGQIEPIELSFDHKIDGYISPKCLLLVELPDLEGGGYSRPYEAFTPDGPSPPPTQRGNAIPLPPPPPPPPPATSSSGAFSGSTWSTKPQPAAPGLCGLVNLGNTCFMNAALQCLSNVPPLTEYMKSDRWQKDLNCTNPLGMRGEIAKVYAALINIVWSGTHSYLAPREFKGAICEFAPQFSGFQQHDCQELMAFLLDGLHEDLNRIVKKPYVEFKEANDRPDAEVAQEAWQRYKARNDSIIVDLFHGQLKSTLVCPECHKVSVTFDPFCYLSLPLPHRQTYSLTFRFVKLDPTQPPMKCRLELPSEGCMALAYDRLGEMFQLSPSSIRIAEVFYHKFQRFLTPTDSYSHIVDKGQFYAFELRKAFSHESETSASSRFKYVCFFEDNFASRSTTYSTNYLGVPQLLELDLEAIAAAEDAATAPSTAVNGGGDLEATEGAMAAPPVPDITADRDSASGVRGPAGIPPSVLRRAVLQRCRLFLDNPERRLNEPLLFRDWWSNERPDCEVEPAPYNMYVSGSSTFRRDTALFLNPEEDDEAGSVVGPEFNYVWVGLTSPTARRLFFDEAAAKTEQVHPSASTAAADSHSGQKPVSLDDCLKLFTDHETLDKKDAWHCPECKRFQCADKKIDIWSLPKVLVCHLKRFSYERHYRSKLDVHVDYPVRNLDLTRWIAREFSDRASYHLLAVAHHVGGLGGGHYTATALNWDSDRWYYYDDSNVRECTSDPVAKSAYVLVYLRSDLARGAGGVE